MNLGTATSKMNKASHIHDPMAYTNDTIEQPLVIDGTPIMDISDARYIYTPSFFNTLLTILRSVKEIKLVFDFKPVV